MEELNEFIKNVSDARELRRALAVKFILQGYDYHWIMEAISVSSSFISKWKIAFEEYGIEGIRLAYKGQKPFLDAQQEAEVISWIKEQPSLTVATLKAHIKQKYNVVYKSRKSYYNLLASANMSWKKSQHHNPKADPSQVEAKKQEIEEFLARWAVEIEKGAMVVYILDECHVVWGDICGYLWGPRDQRIILPIGNERQRQTFYGALNYKTQEFTVKRYRKGDSENTIKFIAYLRAQHPNSQVAIIWDGAPYHTSNAIKEHLAELNQDLAADERLLSFIQFAPYAPEQNPVEPVWLKGKNYLREKAASITRFPEVVRLFLEHLNGKKFAFSANSSIA